MFISPVSCETNFLRKHHQTGVQVRAQARGPLEGLDRINSHGSDEVRCKKKQVAKAVERALDEVEHVTYEGPLSSLPHLGHQRICPSTRISLDGSSLLCRNFESLSATSKFPNKLLQLDRKRPLLSLEEYSPARDNILEFNTALVSDDAPTALKVER